MARLIVDGADLVVGLSWLEKLAILVELSNEAPYARLLVSVPDLESTLTLIRGATGVGATGV